MAEAASWRGAFSLLSLPAHRRHFLGVRADAVLAEATAPQPVVRKGCAAPNRVDKSDTLWQVMDGWRRKQVLGGELT